MAKAKTSGAFELGEARFQAAAVAEQRDRIMRELQRTRSALGELTEKAERITYEDRRAADWQALSVAVATARRVLATTGEAAAPKSAKAKRGAK